MLEFIRKIRAAQNFTLKDDYTFLKFEDISAEKPIETPDELDIWAVVKINFEGELPGSYRALNMVIWDWVEKNHKTLTENLHEQLVSHFDNNYPGTDHSELKTLEDSVIWEDQLDYMPVVNEEEKALTIEIELILHAEEIEEA